MTHILITGGNGFIGANIVDALAENPQYRITVYDLYPRKFGPLPKGVEFIQADLSDPALVRQALVDCGAEQVIHAAWATIHETALKDPRADISANLLPTINLLEACTYAGIQRVHFLSSGGTVYGIPASLPVAENAPTFPINPYGIAKLAVEKYLEMYRHLYGLNYLVYRPSVPYGLYQNPHRRQGAVNVFIYRALHGEPIHIWGDGEVVRDYFYIGDLVSAMEAALERPHLSGQIYNLGGGRGYSLNEIITAIQEGLERPVEVHYEAARKFDVPAIVLDVDKAQHELGWVPRISLEEGIRRTAQWIQNTPELAR